MLKHIRQSDIGDVFPNIEIALRMYLTLPVAKTDGECSHSVLKQIKNRLQSNMGQEKVSDLSTLSIESYITRSFCCNQIIESFARDKAPKKLWWKPCNFVMYFWLLTDVLVYFKYGSMIKRINVIYKGISALQKNKAYNTHPHSTTFFSALGPRKLLIHLCKLLWNVSKLLPDYTAQQPTRQSFSYSP
jgi:hypothetical protein